MCFKQNVAQLSKLCFVAGLEPLQFGSTRRRLFIPDKPQQQGELPVCQSEAARDKALSAVIGRVGDNVISRPRCMEKVNTGLPVSTIIQVRTVNRLASLL